MDKASLTERLEEIACTHQDIMTNQEAAYRAGWQDAIAGGPTPTAQAARSILVAMTDELAKFEADIATALDDLEEGNFLGVRGGLLHHAGMLEGYVALHSGVLALCRAANEAAEGKA